MKKILISSLIAISLFGWGGRGNCKAQFNQSMASSEYKTVYNLTQTQKEALKFMYEEEKLARDVYITLGNKWELRPFLNIQKAEQAHMNAVKALLDKYHIVANVNPSVGSFNIPELQNLYNQLVSKGLKSPKDALEVGRIVEITDIKDLDERMVNATPDMKIVFSHLKTGSEHHLKAFNRFLNFYN